MGISPGSTSDVTAVLFKRQVTGDDVIECAVPVEV